MKRLKYLILILGIFVLSGCSVEYTAIINEETVDETVLSTGMSFNTVPIPAFYDVQGSSETDEKIEGVQYYDIDYNGNNVLLKYKFNFDDYNRSTAANTCFESVKISNVDGGYMINTSNHNYCFDQYPDLQNININLSFDFNAFEVLASNADYINSNIFIWNVNRENFDNKYIQVKFKKKTEEKEEKPKVEEENELSKWANANVGLVIALSLIAVSVIVVLAIAFKRHKM